MADYLVPMAAENARHRLRARRDGDEDSMLGAKGAGEAGTGGATGAIMNAVNGRAAAAGAKVTSQPITRRRCLKR